MSNLPPLNESIESLGNSISETSSITVVKTDKLNKTPSRQKVQTPTRQNSIPKTPVENFLTPDTTADESRLRQSVIYSAESKKSTATLVVFPESVTTELIFPDLKGQFLTIQENEKELIIRELILGEKQYIQDLSLLVYAYLYPIKDKKLLNPKQIESLFNNIESVASVAIAFWNSLEKLIHQPVIGKIGDLLLELSEKLICYTLYSSNVNNALKNLNSHMQHNKFRQFADDMFRQHKEEDLENLLVKPSQRLSSYTKYLKNLLSITESSNEEYPKLKLAADKIKAIVNIINTGAKNSEGIRKIADIQQLFAEKLQFVTPSRYLVREDTLPLLINGSTKKERCIFLCNDLIIIARKDWRDKYHLIDKTTFKNSRVCDVQYEATSGNAKQFLFEIEIGDDSDFSEANRYIFACNSNAIKSLWIESYKNLSDLGVKLKNMLDTEASASVTVDEDESAVSVVDMKFMLSQKTKEVDGLLLKNNELTSRNIELKENLVDLYAKTKETEKSITELKNAETNLKNEAAAANKKLNEEITNHKNEISLLEAAMNKSEHLLKEEIAELNNKLVILKATNQTLLEEKIESKKVSLISAEKFQDMSQIIKQSLNDNERKDDMIKKLEGQYESQKQQLELQKQSFNQNSNELEEMMKQHLETISKLKSDVASMKAIIDDKNYMLMEKDELLKKEGETQNNLRTELSELTEHIHESKKLAKDFQDVFETVYHQKTNGNVIKAEQIKSLTLNFANLADLLLKKDEVYKKNYQEAFDEKLDKAAMITELTLENKILKENTSQAQKDLRSVIANLEEQLREATLLNESLAATVNDLELNLKKGGLEVDLLNTCLIQVTRRLEDTEKQVNEEKVALLESSNALKLEKATSESLAINFASLKSQFFESENSLKNTIAQLKQQEAHLRGELGIAIEVEQTQKLAIENQLMVKNEVLEIQQEETARLSRVSKTLKTENSKLLAKLSAKTKDIEKLKKVSGMQLPPCENNDLKNENSELLSEPIVNFSKRSSVRRSCLNEQNQFDVNQLSLEVATLKDDICTKSNEIKDFQSTINLCYHKISVLENRNNELDNENKNLTERNEKQQDHIWQLKEKFGQLENQLALSSSTYKTSLSYLEAEISLKDNENSLLKAQNAEMRKLNDSIIEDKIASIKLKDDKIENLTKELKKLKCEPPPNYQLITNTLHSITAAPPIFIEKSPKIGEMELKIIPSQPMDWSLDDEKTLQQDRKNSYLKPDQLSKEVMLRDVIYIQKELNKSLRNQLKKIKTELEIQTDKTKRANEKLHKLLRSPKKEGLSEPILFDFFKKGYVLEKERDARNLETQIKDLKVDFDSRLTNLKKSHTLAVSSLVLQMGKKRTIIERLTEENQTIIPLRNDLKDVTAKYQAKYCNLEKEFENQRVQLANASKNAGKTTLVLEQLGRLKSQLNAAIADNQKKHAIIINLGKEKTNLSMRLRNFLKRQRLHASLHLNFINKVTEKMELQDRENSKKLKNLEIMFKGKAGEVRERDIIIGGLKKENVRLEKAVEKYSIEMKLIIDEKEKFESSLKAEQNIRNDITKQLKILKNEIVQKGEQIKTIQHAEKLSASELKKLSEIHAKTTTTLETHLKHQNDERLKTKQLEITMEALKNDLNQRKEEIDVLEKLVEKHEAMEKIQQDTLVSERERYLDTFKINTQLQERIVQLQKQIQIE